MSVKFDLNTLGKGFEAEWPVKVPVPQNGGAVQEQEFMAVFRTLTPEGQAEIDAIEDKAEKARAAVRKVFVGLAPSEGVILDDALFDQLWANDWTQMALLRAVSGFRTGIAAKN